jgi:hypothetical protein
MIVGMLFVICFMLGMIMQGVLKVVELLREQNAWLKENDDEV